MHQITTVVRETEGLAHVTSTRKFYEQDWADAAVKDYLTAMGVGDPVMALLRKTPAASVHWLSLADLRASRLATLALDAAEPILTSGANGLNARAFDGDPPPPNVLRARIAEPLALPIAGRGVMLEIAFRYRRGGGAVEAQVAARDADMREAADPPASGWILTLTADGVEPLQLKTAGPSPQRAIVPRERFCALARGGKLIAEPMAGTAAGAWADEPPVVFALTEMVGTTAVLDGSLPVKSDPRVPGTECVQFCAQIPVFSRLGASFCNTQQMRSLIHIVYVILRYLDIARFDRNGSPVALRAPCDDSHFQVDIFYLWSHAA